MHRTPAQSSDAITASKLTQSLQSTLVNQLEHVSLQLDSPQPFTPSEWGRDEGRHGGGLRYGIADSPIFNRASINYSQVHYDDDNSKKLGSATALSTIIHPQNPHAPSMHMHISWTELKQGAGYWRMMADLNPAIANDADSLHFKDSLKQAAPTQFDSASAQGDRYFFIPALNRHRGIQHFYLEEYSSGDKLADLALAQSFGEAVINCYSDILFKAISQAPQPSALDIDNQLAYHTLYFFQVLTLDRGTTSGLLIHDQNDVGILGSLPAQINTDLLARWLTLMPAPQEKLLQGLLAVLPNTSRCTITETVKQALALCIRTHYQQYPEAIALQASSHIIPPTVDNHN